MRGIVSTQDIKAMLPRPSRCRSKSGKATSTRALQDPLNQSKSLFSNLL